MIKNSVLLLLLFSFCRASYSQSIRQYTTNNNGWFMYFGDHKFTKKLGIHLEAQFRRHDIIISGQQLLLRTGINYHLNDNAFLTAGYCFVETYKYGKFASKSDFPENRFWQQVQTKTQMGKIEVMNRYRFEQRFIYLPILNSDTVSYSPSHSATYQNRIRLMTRVSVPFKGNKINDKSFYFSLYDEVFLNFGKNVGLNYIDQNRAYVAVGYKIPKLGRLEIGYMNQLLIKSDGVKIENNHTLQIGLSSVLNFY
ncbi:MAG: DUF2490 domain-containing protein [Bacteroidia bacterium]